MQHAFPSLSGFGLHMSACAQLLFFSFLVLSNLWFLPLLCQLHRVLCRGRAAAVAAGCGWLLNA